MADATAARASASLADVLWALGPDGADAIFPSRDGRSKRQRPVAAARLACRALRDAIDGSVTQLHLRLRPADARHWRPGLLHERWPRCSSVVVNLSRVKGRGNGKAALLALPFEGLRQSAARATRITSVALATQRRELPGAEQAIALVAHRLPWMKQLDLAGFHEDGLSCEPGPLARMWQALAAAPELVGLRLPSLRTLTGAKDVPACGKLRSLSARITPFLTGSMWAEAAAGLSHLTGLESLALSNAHAPITPACLPLLDSLPPSLEVLTLSTDGNGNPTELQLRLEGGRITSVQTSSHMDLPAKYAMSLWGLARIVAVLLRSRALGARIERLKVSYVYVNADHPVVPRGDEEALRALVQRAGVVELGDIVIDAHLKWYRKSEMTAVTQVVELFGKPASLQFWDRLKMTLHIKDSPGGHGSASSSGGASSGGAVGAAAVGELPPVSSFLRVVMLRVEAAATAAAAAARAAPDSAKPAPHMLLLSGPAVATRADDGGVWSWVSEVNNGKSIKLRDSRVQCCALVSQADALLLQLCSLADAEAIAADAAKDWAAGAQMRIWPTPNRRTDCASKCIRVAVNEELQAVWAPRFASAARDEGPVLLRWLWGVRAGVATHEDHPLYTDEDGDYTGDYSEDYMGEDEDGDED